MKHTNTSPYATNRGGLIRAPKDTAKDQPKSVVRRGDDLRRKAGK